MLANRIEYLQRESARKKWLYSVLGIVKKYSCTGSTVQLWTVSIFPREMCPIRSLPTLSSEDRPLRRSHDRRLSRNFKESLIC